MLMLLVKTQKTPKSLFSVNSLSLYTPCPKNTICAVTLFGDLVIGLVGVGVSSLNACVRKGFLFDAEYLMVALLFLLVIFSAKAMAFSVEAPSIVEVNDSTSFFVTIINDTDSSVPIKTSFFSPLVSTVSAPSEIAPNSSTQAEITLTNSNFSKGETINSTVEVAFGDTVIQKVVSLSFTNTQKSSNLLSAAFGLGSFISETSGFTLLDWLIFWFLVIVAAILLVSFIARVRKRV